MNIVPAWIDYTDESLGPCLFLECGEMGSAMSWLEETDEYGNTTNSGTSSGGRTFGSGRSNSTEFGSQEVDETDYNDGALAQTKAGKAIAKGEQEKSDAYYDKIYVGFWDGADRFAGLMPHPMTDILEIRDDFIRLSYPYSLRINQEQEEDDNGIPLKYTYDIDNRKKYTFSFLSVVIPDPRALFYIEGRKYVAEKITATFHEGTGKSQLLKISCFRVRETT